MLSLYSGAIRGDDTDGRQTRGRDGHGDPHDCVRVKGHDGPRTTGEGHRQIRERSRRLSQGESLLWSHMSVNRFYLRNENEMRCIIV